MESSVKRFFNLFKGFEGAYGRSNLKDGSKRSDRHGKKETVSWVVHEQLTEDLIQEHLEGKTGIGSFLIDETNKCRFGALDVDDYTLDLVAFKKKIKKLKLPLVVCRSKSGGAHAFLFCHETIFAAEIKDKLSEFASSLGYGNCEIFPKQEEVNFEKGDRGNFINLPYFKADLTMRYALDDKGEALSLEDFLTLAENSRVTEEELHNLTLGVSKDILPAGPPCLQQLTNDGLPEGGRNTSLFNIGLYYKLSSPENWRELLEEHNREYCSPPLPAKEIVMIQEQLVKKEYFYQCKQEPLLSYCNKSVCRTRKFGIGQDNSFPVIGGLTVVESEPPVWFMDVDGTRLELTTKQLQMQIDFQRACMEQMYKMPPKMKERDWRILIDQTLENATRIPVPEELTQKGLFTELLEIFCTSRIQAHSPEELLTGKPWTEGGFTYFKLSSLQDFLKRNNFLNYTRGQTTQRLKELNQGKEATKNYRFSDTEGKRKRVRVWFVPEMDRGEVELPEVVFEEEEVPF
tara:strand:- start:5673 stop:7220 length:1548 start_codon:yes stop_codon:yes gene_type:complete